MLIILKFTLYFGSAADRRLNIDLTLERFSLDCRKTKTKVNTLANQRA